MCWGVKIWWKYGSELQFLRIDGVNLDPYKYNSNEGTTGTQAMSTNLESEEESLSSFLEMGRRVAQESQAIIGARRGSVSQNLRRDWKGEGIFWWNIINREVGSGGDGSKWFHLLGMHDKKRNTWILKVAQPLLGSVLILWLCDMESHHRWNTWTLFICTPSMMIVMYTLWYCYGDLEK